MTESRIGLTERLRREGRWEEAAKFKDVAIRDLRAKGIRKAEASEHAWEAMANAFPPLANTGDGPPEAMAGEPLPPQQPGGTAPDIDVEALLDRLDNDRQPPDLIRDTLWAYENLENRWTKPEDAPSLGAWSLLLWARQYRNRFFEQVLPRAMMNKPEEEADIQRYETRAIADCHRILQQMMQADGPPPAGVE
jgi:hypothetical protein